MSDIKVGEPFPLDIGHIGDCDGEFHNGPFVATCVLDTGHGGKHVASDGQKVIEVWA